MRKSLLILPILFFTACSQQASSVKPDAAKSHAQKQEITPEKMQEAMAKASAIGENHRKLDPLIGKYNVEAKLWMKPGGEPEITGGTAEFAWALSGHFVAIDYNSSFQGQPYMGKGFYGYNNIDNRYEAVWVDSMGTGMMKSEGRFEADGSTLVFTGEFSCPITDGKMKSKEVVRLGTDKHVMEFYHDAFDGSGPYKAMEIVYTKQKSGKTAAKKVTKT